MKPKPKPRPRIETHLWPDSATGVAVGHARVHVKWREEFSGWEVWREDWPEQRLVLHAWVITTARAP